MQHLKHLTLLALLGTAQVGAADEQQRLQQLRSNINELRQDIGSDKQEQTQQQKRLNRLERQIAESKRRLRAIETELAEQRRLQAQLQNQVTELNRRLERQKQLLAQQLRASYTPDEQQTLKLLLNQTSPAEASRTLTYYSYFSLAQAETLEATRNDISALEQSRAQLEESGARLASLQQQQQAQQEELASGKKEQQQLLSKLGNRIESNEKSLAAMLADAEALTKLLRDLEAKRAKSRETPAPGALKGKLQWPLKGRIEHSFGESRNQGRMRWQGMVIGGQRGEEIRAAAPGKVVFADQMRGYGLLLIIDHGNNLMSLYGHNQRLNKQAGESVTANEVIALLGSVDSGSEGHLYFELRHKGKPVDPEKWLR